MINEYKKAVRNQHIVNEEREGFARELLTPNAYTTARLSDDVTRNIERMSVVEIIS